MGSGADAGGRGAGLGVGVAWRGKRRNLEWQCSWIELAAARSTGLSKAVVAATRHRDFIRGANQTPRRVAKNASTTAPMERSFAQGDAPSSSLSAGGAGHQSLWRSAAMSHDTPSDAKKRKTSENDGHGIVSTTTAQLSGSKAAGSEELRRSANPKSEKKCKVMEGIEPKETNSDSDISTTALYEQIDAAQKRVASLKERLNRAGAEISQKTLDGKFKARPEGREKHGRHLGRRLWKKLNNTEQTMRSTSTTSSRPKVPRSMSNAPYETITTLKVDQLVLSLRLLRYSRTMSLLTRTFLTSLHSQTREIGGRRARRTHRSSRGRP